MHWSRCGSAPLANLEARGGASALREQTRVPFQHSTDGQWFARSSHDIEKQLDESIHTACARTGRLLVNAESTSER
ncbi:MAG: hypothetical protein DWH96_12305 [Planctomycetota bacterium]|nr:MAG: hypothetical protein DWH96_12305 [Planctomycetota bacterium]